MNREPADFKHADVVQIPSDWQCVQLDDVAKRGSGHTPDKKHPEYWNGDIKWVSLRDSEALDKLFLADTAASITPEGIANSSAVLHPVGTVILSRDAGVGKSAILRSSMAVSQHFMAWQCGPKLDNVYLYYWLQHMKPEFERIAMGSTIKTIGLPYFEALRIPLPPRDEQSGIAAALRHLDECIEGLQALIAKKRDVKQAAMQQLLSGEGRKGASTHRWRSASLGSMGSTYSGLAGKNKSHFGRGAARYIPFMNVMTNTVMDPGWTEPVDVAPQEFQTTVRSGDLLFNGSSETPEEVGYCSVVLTEVPGLYLNSFCFGFRFRQGVLVDGRFFAYWFRSSKGRDAMAVLAQGATRYNIAKSAFLRLFVPVPPLDEQREVADVLSDIDREIATLVSRRDKAISLKQGMMQQLLTGRIRLL